MKLRLSSPMAGMNFSHKPGDVIEVDEAEALRHVANGNGLIVVDEPAGPAKPGVEQLRGERDAARKALAEQEAENDRLKKAANDEIERLNEQLRLAKAPADAGGAETTTTTPPENASNAPNGLRRVAPVKQTPAK